VKNIGKPCAGKPHARFDEGGQARACSLLYPLCALEELVQGKGAWMRLAHDEAPPEWLQELIAYVSCVKTKPRRMKVLKELAVRLKICSTIHKG
jgi:hypothetical protein